MGQLCEISSRAKGVWSLLDVLGCLCLLFGPVLASLFVCLENGQGHTFGYQTYLASNLVACDWEGGVHFSGQSAPDFCYQGVKH